MLINYIVLFVPAVAVGVVGALSAQGRQLSYFILPLVFLMVSGVLALRDPTAPQDYFSYSLMYEYVSDLNSVFDVYHKDYFFSFLQYGAKSLGFGVEAFSIIFSVFCYFVVTVAARLFFYDSRYAVASAAIFSLTSTFILLFTNVLRQGLALAFVLLFIGLVYRKRYVLSVIAGLLACFSHSSAFMVVILVLLVSIYPLTKSRRLFLLYLIPVLPFAGSVVLSFFSGLGGYFVKIDGYSDYEYSNNLVYVKAVILYLSLWVFYICDRDGSLGREEAVVPRLVDVFACSVAIAFLSMPILIISSRFIYYASGLLPFIIVGFLCGFRLAGMSMRTLVFLFALTFFGYFSYFFESTGKQLGLY